MTCSDMTLGIPSAVAGKATRCSLKIPWPIFVHVTVAFEHDVVSFVCYTSPDIPVQMQP